MSSSAPHLRRLTVGNSSQLEVDLLYVCTEADDEQERSYLRLQPGETRTQETFADHQWRLRSRPDGALLATVRCGDVDLFVTDISPVVGEEQPCLAFTNRTQLGEAEVLYINEESGAEASYLRVPPGESRTQNTFLGHTWRCKAAADGTMLAAVVAGAANARLGLGGSDGQEAASAGPSAAAAEAFYSQVVTVGSSGLRVRAHADVSPQAALSPLPLSAAYLPLRTDHCRSSRC